eukprot:366359-Chlamydomonas_euryale.AAC.2
MPSAGSNSKVREGGGRQGSLASTVQHTCAVRKIFSRSARNPSHASKLNGRTSSRRAAVSAGMPSPRLRLFCECDEGRGRVIAAAISNQDSAVVTPHQDLPRSSTPTITKISRGNRCRSCRTGDASVASAAVVCHIVLSPTTQRGAQDYAQEASGQACSKKLAPRPCRLRLAPGT